MHQRLRQGRRLIVRIDGNYGSYRTELTLGRDGEGWCTCPSDGRPCKHMRALRKTWRVNPRSFLDLENLLGDLSRRPRRSLMAAVGAMIAAHPECLSALGIPGFEAGEDEDDGNPPDLAELVVPPPARAPQARRFTALQGQYLAFIRYYRKLHGRAPAEADLQRYFRVSPPSVHRMIVALAARGLIGRQPGRARSIRLLVEPHEVPDLGE